MKRRRPVTRWVIAAALLLIGGAIINVAVAWTIGLRVDTKMEDATIASGFDPHTRSMIFRHSSPHAVRIVSHWGGLVFSIMGQLPTDPAKPLAPKWGDWVLPDDDDVPTRITHAAIAWEYGWPRRSLGGGVDVLRDWDNSVEVRYYSAWPLDRSLLANPNDHWKLRLIALRPIWPAFAINTLFYAAILWGVWMLFAMPFALRRWRRKRRGLCPACAYPIGTSPVCTECGRAVVRHKRPTTSRGAS